VIEREVLNSRLGDETFLERFGKAGQGSRRILRLVPSGLNVVLHEADPSVMTVEFELPKGAYATTFLSCALVLLDVGGKEIERTEETSRHDELFQHPHVDSE
jgi:tRNA(Glu) U13 pseudouridine synthase TruD